MTSVEAARDIVGRLVDAGRIYLRLIEAQVRAEMQYRVSFLLSVLAVFIGTATDFAAILILFHRFEHIGGWMMPEVALLYGLVSTSFALAHLLGQGFEEFSQVVRDGSFDQVLIKPRSAFLQVLGSQLPLRQVGRLIQGGGVLLLALYWLDPGWGLVRWLFAGWTILGGVLFFLGIMLLSATFAFWTVESIEAMNILTYGGTEMASYPLHIFAPWLRRTFVYIIPLAFVNYVPTLYLLDKPNPLGMPAWAPLAALPLCAVVLLIGLAGWRFGVRHYLSTGH